MKGQAQDWDKIFAKYLFNKELLSKAYKSYSQKSIGRLPTSALDLYLVGC